jgi:site-specific recombinase XerD
LADKLRRASPHWKRHTQAAHALRNGADLKNVQDNLQHASIATTTIHPHSDQARHARQKVSVPRNVKPDHPATSLQLR